MRMKSGGGTLVSAFFSPLLFDFYRKNKRFENVRKIVHSKNSVWVLDSTGSCVGCLPQKKPAAKHETLLKIKCITTKKAKRSVVIPRRDND